MDTDEILLDTEERMEKAAQVFSGQLHGIRTGRATPGLVDSIRVDYYGSQTPIKQMANVTVQEGKQIVIRPYDATAISNIVKAIQTSDVGLTPKSDGRLIFFNDPPPSTENRRKLAARVKEMAEEARVAIRNVRRDGNKHADTAQKEKTCTEDERDQAKEQIQDLTKTFEGKVNDLAAAKEKEIMEE